MAFPIAGLNERIVRAGFSTRGVYSVISSLLEKGLISSASVSTLRGKKRIIRLTNAGWNVLGLTGDPNHAKRHESIEHWYWKLTLAQKFHKEGCRVQVEKDGSRYRAGKGRQENCCWKLRPESPIRPRTFGGTLRQDSTKVWLYGYPGYPDQRQTEQT